MPRRLFPPFPQHQRLSFSSIRQLCFSPREIAFTPLNGVKFPDLSVTVVEIWEGKERSTMSPSPSWPALPSPQHFAVVSAKIAQVLSNPATKLITPTIEVTSTGADLFDELPIPSCPCSLLPQQYTFPDSDRAQT